MAAPQCWTERRGMLAIQGRWQVCLKALTRSLRFDTVSECHIKQHMSSSTSLSDQAQAREKTRRRAQGLVSRRNLVCQDRENSGTPLGRGSGCALFGAKQRDETRRLVSTASEQAVVHNHTPWPRNLSAYARSAHKSNN